MDLSSDGLTTVLKVYDFVAGSEILVKQLETENGADGFCKSRFRYM
jgi:hypothetical protein